MTRPASERAILAADYLDSQRLTSATVLNTLDVLSIREVCSWMREQGRLLVGIRAERDSLRAQVRAPEAINLSEVSTPDLLKEIERRVT